jgi:hypothetical protein
MSELDLVSARISAFRSNLTKSDVATLVQRHVTTGPSFVLNDEIYHRLRAKVAAQFGLHANEVLIVGSGKLGFSIVGKKRYRPFGDESDLDVAVRLLCAVRYLRKSDV